MTTRYRGASATSPTTDVSARQTAGIDRARDTHTLISSPTAHTGLLVPGDTSASGQIGEAATPMWGRLAASPPRARTGSTGLLQLSDSGDPHTGLCQRTAGRTPGWTQQRPVQRRTVRTAAAAANPSRHPEDAPPAGNRPRSGGTMLTDPLPQISAVLPGPGWARLCADSAGVLLGGQPLVTGRLAPDIESANRVVADLTLLIQHVVEHGGAAYLAEDRSGIAVWAGAPEPLPPVAALRRTTIDPDHAARWATLEDVLRSTASDGGPCHLLVLLAAAGDSPVAGQRAAALLRHHYSILDQQERPATTAAYTIELRCLLARHGWTAGPRGHLPDGSPWWPMHREPQPPSTPSGPSARPATHAVTAQPDKAPR